MNDRIKIAKASTPQNKMEGGYWGIKKPVRSATSTKITNRYGGRIALSNSQKSQHDDPEYFIDESWVCRFS